MTELRLLTERPLPTSAVTRAFTTDQILAARPDIKALTPILRETVVPTLPQAATAAITAVRLPAPAAYPLQVEGTGPLNLTLPFGFEERVVNAATLKALAGRPNDNLLRKHGPTWALVEDAELIDLDDQSVVFRLGRVEIYS